MRARRRRLEETRREGKRNTGPSGTSLLVVDGTDVALTRKAEVAIRPTRHPAYAMVRGDLQLSADSYNAGARPLQVRVRRHETPLDRRMVIPAGLRRHWST